MTQPSQRDLVAQYFDGFRASDHHAVLATLTDDVEWVIQGARTTRGKAEFDSEIENPDFTGSPTLDVHQTFEDGPVVIVVGRVAAPVLRTGLFTSPSATSSPSATT